MTNEQKVEKYAKLTAEFLNKDYSVIEFPSYYENDYVCAEQLAELLKPFFKQILEES